MKRISQRDIAKMLGINVSTVSRALKGQEGVSLRYDTTHTIGVVVPDVSFNHFAHIAKRFEAEAKKAGYMCIITDDSNPLYITKGNPGLKPQFTNSLNAYFNTYIVRHKRSIVAYLNYRHIRNSISNMVRYDPATGGSISRPENINGNWNINGGFTFNTAIDSTAHWNVGTDTRIRYNNFVSYVAQQQADAEKNTTHR